MAMPKSGDKILIMKEKWLCLILGGHKTMEIRATPFRRGKYYLGHKGLIYAEVQLGSPIPIESDEQWRALAPKHKVTCASRPYKNTFGFGIMKLNRTRKFGYHHPRGAISIVRYRRT